MKLVKTRIRATTVEDVCDALGRLDIGEITVTAVRGHRHQPKPAPSGGGSPLPPDAMIEVVVDDESVAEVIETITHATRPTPTGTAHISVFPLDHGQIFATDEPDP